MSKSKNIATAANIVHAQDAYITRQDVIDCRDEIGEVAFGIMMSKMQIHGTVTDRIASDKRLSDAEDALSRLEFPDTTGR